MSERPNVLVVDDDAAVLSAVERDMKRRYSERYRVMAAQSGAEALEMLKRLELRDEQVAMVIADQRMPQMTGTELLATVAGRSRQTRRVLLTAYADTDAAIEAINLSGVDYYILKPWDPPEERLYPVVDDLLDDWESVGRKSPDIGLRVVGDRWSVESNRLREFLSRNQVPFRWLETGRHAEADRLVAAAPSHRLPLLILEDGTVLSDPATEEVAEAVGMQPVSDLEFYDLVVVGAGPGGLAAAVYGASEGLSTAVVEAEAPGGQASASSRIENYLGFPQGVSGADLARRAYTQARRFGADFVTPRRVTGLGREGPYRILQMDDGGELRCWAVIVATGVQYRTLEAPGAEALVGRGIYYGSTATHVSELDGERVVIVGGANSAGQAAVHLADNGSKVHLVVRAASLAERMSSYLVTQVESRPGITVRTSCQVQEVEGEERLERVKLGSPVGSESLDVSALFVFIGARPRTEWLDGVVARDGRGFLLTGSDLVSAGRWAGDRSPMLLETSVPGVFAVGDVRSESVKRVASAVGEGSVAVHLVHAYLAE
ncbi:MAG: FAD-dependent oxidoreductase [Actinomycetota bacterium]